MREIDLMSNEELLEVVVKRFNHCIFLGTKEGLGNIGTDKSKGTYHCAGLYDVCLGLTVKLQQIVLKMVVQEGDKSR